MSLKKKYLIQDVYTDGSTINNKLKNTRSYGGYGIYWGPHNPLNRGSPFVYSPITNNRCELFAILMAIQTFLEYSSSKYAILNIYSDSQYCVHTISKWRLNWKKNNWKKKDGKSPENLDLIQMIDNLICNTKVLVNFHHIYASHDHHEPSNKNSIEWKHWFGNNQADMLARQGSSKRV